MYMLIGIGIMCAILGFISLFGKGDRKNPIGWFTVFSLCWGFLYIGSILEKLVQ